MVLPKLRCATRDLVSDLSHYATYRAWNMDTDRLVFIGLYTLGNRCMQLLVPYRNVGDSTPLAGSTSRRDVGATTEGGAGGGWLVVESALRSSSRHTSLPSRHSCRPITRDPAIVSLGFGDILFRY